MKKIPRIIKPTTATPPTTPPTIAPIGVPELLLDGPELAAGEAEASAVEVDDAPAESLVVVEGDVVASRVEDALVESSVVGDVVLPIKLEGVASSSKTRVLLWTSQSQAVTVEPLVENSQVMQYGRAD